MTCDLNGTPGMTNRISFSSHASLAERWMTFDLNGTPGMRLKKRNCLFPVTVKKKIW